MILNREGAVALVAGGLAVERPEWSWQTKAAAAEAAAVSVFKSCEAALLDGVLVLAGVLEEDHEKDSDDKGVACEYVPRGCPAWFGCIDYIVVDDQPRNPGSNRGAQTVCHEHEETLCAGADVAGGLAVDVERTGNVEEVEGDTVDDAGKHEQPYARARVAKSEETEPEHPCEHGDEHDFLDAESLHEEWNEEDAERL
jgi:hypothetical protein